VRRVPVEVMLGTRVYPKVSGFNNEINKNN